MESVVYNVTRDEDYVQPKNNAGHMTNYVDLFCCSLCWESGISLLASGTASSISFTVK